MRDWISVRADELPPDKAKVLFIQTIKSCYSYKQYKIRMGIFLKQDQWGRENMFCDGAFFNSEKIAFWMLLPELPIEQNVQVSDTTEEANRITKS